MMSPGKQILSSMIRYTYSLDDDHKMTVDTNRDGRKTQYPVSYVS